MEKTGLFSGKCEVCGKIFYADDLNWYSAMVPVMPFYHWTEYDEVCWRGFAFECCGKKQTSEYDDADYIAIMTKHIKKERRRFEHRLHTEVNKRIDYETFDFCKKLFEKLNETLDNYLED